MPQNTTAIFDIPTNYTATFTSTIPFYVGNALKITFPTAEFTVKANSTCHAAGFFTTTFNSAYTCVASSTDNTIIIGSFTSATIAAVT